MKTVAIIQARLGSSRLPGKVLLDLAGRPVLSWIVRAARAATGIDEVWVATSTSSGDDAIAAWCDANGVQVFRGSESDVLDRYAGAARESRADIVVRLTADCPLNDAVVIGQTVRLCQMTGVDYASNIDPPTWPDGLDCEVMTAEALYTAAAEAVRSSDREHVTPFIRNHRRQFSSETLVSPLPKLNDERWTLDTPEDLAFLSAVTKHLDPDKLPSYLEVLDILDRDPSIRTLNAKQVRNAGFALSLAAETDSSDKRFDESEALLKRAEQIIPLGTQTFSKSRLQFPPGASPLFVTHGDGGKVYDVDGNEYVDLVNALLPNVLGYRDPDVDLAIRRQLTRGITFSLATDLEVELAERLKKHIPSAEMVRFGKNGTDVTSAAVRLARAATGRDRIIMLGYHGWQDWFIGATTRNLGVPAAVSALSHTAPYGDLDAIENLLTTYPGEVAAVILEPMNATEPPAGYLAGLKALIHRHGALLIFDEMITGFRWSVGGAQSYYNVVPDLSCFGKAMGNGMPISAVVGRADIMKLMEDIFYSGTFSGETLSLVAAIATIDKLERDHVTASLWTVGRALSQAVRTRIAENGLENVIGLLGAAPWSILSFKDHATASKEAIKTLFLREMLAAGVLINASHNVCYAHSSADIARVLAAYDRALPVLKDALSAGDLDRRLNNQVIKPIFSIRAVS